MIEKGLESGETKKYLKSLKKYRKYKAMHFICCFVSILRLIWGVSRTKT